MARNEIPHALSSAVIEFNKSPERQYERAYKDFLEAINEIKQTQAGSLSVHRNVWETPKVIFEEKGEKFKLWVEEHETQDNGGRSSEVALKISPLEHIVVTEADIFTWSHSGKIRDASTRHGQGGDLRDPEKIRNYTSILEFVKERIKPQAVEEPRKVELTQIAEALRFDGNDDSEPLLSTGRANHFNEVLGAELPDETLLTNLRLPSGSELVPLDAEVRDTIASVDPNTRGKYNAMLTGLRRHYETVGQVRKLDRSALAGHGIGEQGFDYAQIAFAKKEQLA